jgi:plasmid maintenance system antidote protein VapI
VNGKSGISPEMAIRLTKAFGSTEETKLIPVLVQAVKELETKNEKMSEQISVLTSEIAGLRIDIDDSKRAR